MTNPCRWTQCIHLDCPTAAENVKGCWYDARNRMVVSRAGEPLAGRFLLECVSGAKVRPEVFAAYDQWRIARIRGMNDTQDNRYPVMLLASRVEAMRGRVVVTVPSGGFLREARKRLGLSVEPERDYDGEIVDLSSLLTHSMQPRRAVLRAVKGRPGEYTAEPID